MGTRLPSAGEVLIIRPTGKKGSSCLIVPTGFTPSLPGLPARKPGHSKAGSERNAVQSECGPEFEEYDPRLAISRVFKEPY